MNSANFSLLQKVLSNLKTEFAFSIQVTNGRLTNGSSIKKQVQLMSKFNVLTILKSPFTSAKAKDPSLFTKSYSHCAKLLCVLEWNGILENRLFMHIVYIASLMILVGLQQLL